MTQTPTQGNTPALKGEAGIRKFVRTCTDAAVLDHFTSRISFVNEVLNNFPTKVYPASPESEQVKQEALTLLTQLAARGLLPANVRILGDISPGHELQTSPAFYTGFQQALLNHEQCQPLSDGDLVRIFVRISCRQDRDDFWRIGYFAGLFAGLYGIPYRWEMSEAVRTLQYRLDSEERVTS